MRWKVGFVAIATLVVVVVLLLPQPDAPDPPLPCTINAECTMAGYYLHHTPDGTVVATRCSPIYCVTLLAGPVNACVQTRYGLPQEVSFRPMSVCDAAVAGS